MKEPIVSALLCVRLTSKRYFFVCVYVCVFSAFRFGCCIDEELIYVPKLHCNNTQHHRACIGEGGFLLCLCGWLAGVSNARGRSARRRGGAFLKNELIGAIVFVYTTHTSSARARSRVSMPSIDSSYVIIVF